MEFLQFAKRIVKSIFLDVDLYTRYNILDEVYGREREKVDTYLKEYNLIFSEKSSYILCDLKKFLLKLKGKCSKHNILKVRRILSFI